MMETGLDRDTLSELYPVFLEELLSEKDKLLNYYKTNDMVKLGKVIHNIKGISGSYKAVVVYNQACLMDSDVKQGLYDNISGGLSNLVSEIDAAISDIKEKILVTDEI